VWANERTNRVLVPGLELGTHVLFLSQIKDMDGRVKPGQGVGVSWCVHSLVSHAVSSGVIQPPLLAVVNAASAVSARTLTCREPAVPRSCSMLSVYMAVRVRPFPKLPPLEENGCGPSTLISPA
jgi:hypothetical protein